ncbi:transcription factor domain-containing protein [Aspergillus novofumigatus IBT 16806]|uniref:Putative fungal-specific transcription factor n=1 Tax=Aspergillus novofumigatus (strain IBT 16806) TaxID=1392255 RepID=A0A2I1BU29_ASPN1|nr:putative fungal-specific transcription factor [Aspergillus novofumigatus IBT 16806]PKX88879.1 putative fungal-specific transcription factor [Aspergillus novofumigatus IBT 16806]
MTPRTINSGRSCLECRRRKIRCDRSFPCSYCIHTKIRCAYPPPETGRRPAAQGNRDLQNQIDHLERRLLALEQVVSTTRDLLQTPSNLSDSDTLQIDHGVLGHHDSPSELTSRPRQPQFRSVLQVLREADDRPLNSTRHEPTLTIRLWQTYLEFVDPLLKIFHTPTVQRYVVDSMANEGTLDVSRRCLLFAIYYSAIVIVPARSCHNVFGAHKTSLLERYRNQLEKAFAEANILRSQDLTLLQAFVLYLTTGRRDERGPDVSVFIGPVIDIAYAIGLHRDGADVNLPPFDVEMRRRLWWHIVTLDVRIAEDSSTEPRTSLLSFNTKMPSNTNDICLDPHMGNTAVCQSGKTEMSFSLIRFTVTEFALRSLFSKQLRTAADCETLDCQRRLKELDQLKEGLELRYLSCCDENIPFDFVVAESTRLVLAKIRLYLRRPPLTEHNTVRPFVPNYWKECVDILGHAYSLRRYEKGAKWLWLFQTYVEWDALAYLLIYLCFNGCAGGAESAWKTAEDVYHHWREDPDVYRDRRWKQIEALWLEAQSGRKRDHMVSRQSHLCGPGQNPGFTDAPNNLSCPDQPAYMRRLNHTSSTTNGKPEDFRCERNYQPSDSHLTNTAPTGDTSLGIPQQLLTGAEDVPTSGTRCEWSALLFERYFNVLDKNSDVLSTSI